MEWNMEVYMSISPCIDIRLSKHSHNNPLHFIAPLMLDRYLPMFSFYQIFRKFLKKASDRFFKQCKLSPDETPKE